MTTSLSLLSTREEQNKADPWCKTENNRLKVKTVDSNDYKGDTLCTWKTPDGKTVKPVMHTNATDGSQALVFDKPTAIGSVSCKGKCVPVGSE